MKVTLRPMARHDPRGVAALAVPVEDALQRLPQCIDWWRCDGVFRAAGELR
jgi:hypothetical protein